jgi:hypothetical protein
VLLKLLTGPLWFNTNLQDFNVSNGVCKFKSIVKPLSMFMFRYPSMAFPPKAALILDLHFNRFPSCSSDPVISGENVDLNMTSPFKVGFLKSEILPSMTDFLPYDTRI